MTVAIIVLVVTLFIVIANIPTFYMLIGNRRYDKGDIDGAFRVFESAYSSGKLRPTFVIYYAYLVLRHKSPEKAYAMLKKLIDSKKCNPQTLLRAKHNAALARWKMGELDEAIELLEKVHTTEPTTITTGCLGVLYLERAKRDNDYESAMRFAKEAYEYNDNDITIADNMGELYVLCGENEKAKEIYEALFASQSPKTPTPYYNYARALLALGERESAQDEAQKALRCRFTNLTAVTREEIESFINTI